MGSAHRLQRRQQRLFVEVGAYLGGCAFWAVFSCLPSSSSAGNGNPSSASASRTNSSDLATNYDQPPAVDVLANINFFRKSLVVSATAFVSAAL